MPMSGDLLIWWAVLCAAAAFNVAAWVGSAWLLGRRQVALAPGVYRTRRRLLWLSAGYVLGCGFRSILPMVDVPRMCLHDTVLSRIAVGRSVATVAELCFAAQWALVLREAGAAAGSRSALLVARIVVPLIFVAELLSWGAVLTSNYLLHAAENSLWTLAALFAAAAFAVLLARPGDGQRRVLVAAIVCATAYVTFMALVDVPMYVARWQADLAAGNAPVAIAAGLRDVLQRCTVTRDWGAWRQDVPWLTLYFSVAVWISIALAHLPAFARVSGTPDAAVRPGKPT
jgi:hypothetical protein